MSKDTVVRIFYGSMVALVAGVIFGFLAVWGAFASGAFVMDGPDVVGIDTHGMAWLLVLVAGTACLVIVGGAIGGMVAWIGALLNTAQLADKTWFVLLLILGLLSFGLVGMIAYVIAGPDGTRRPSQLPTSAA
jgi:hypothetical protein